MAKNGTIKTDFIVKLTCWNLLCHAEFAAFADQPAQSRDRGIAGSLVLQNAAGRSRRPSGPPRPPCALKQPLSPPDILGTAIDADASADNCNLRAAAPEIPLRRVAPHDYGTKVDTSSGSNGERASTLADVAARAGVSSKTVSRVVTGHPNVSDTTRRKVESAISELDFRINYAARSLASARSFFIAIITTHVGSSYMAELYRGAIHAVRTRGYHLTIEEVGADEQAMVSDLDRCLKSVPYDGIILPPPVADNMVALDLLDRYGIRYVRIAPATDANRSHAVFADEGFGVERLVEHLWSMGHRRFGMIQGPANHHATEVRSNAFARSVERLGGEYTSAPSLSYESAAPAVTAGYFATQRLLAGKMRPTALFAFNDDMAAGSIMCARELGFSVPSEISIAGFDDSETAKVTCPPLTTIRQPIRELSEIAVNYLITNGFPGEPQHVIRPVELIIRGSTDPSKGALDL